MLMFQNQQPDHMDAAESWGRLRPGFYEKIAKETHQPTPVSIMPRIVGLGKLAGVNLGILNIKQASPGMLIGVGVPVAGLAGGAAWAIFNSFRDEKNGFLKFGLFMGGVLAGAIVLCAVSSVARGIGVATGLIPPDAANITMQNPQTGAQATATVQNPANATPLVENAVTSTAPTSAAA